MLANKIKTWVVTADRAKAKTFEWLPEHNSLKEIANLEEKDARKPERDLKADRPGHGNNPTARYSVNEKSSYKQQASQNFLKEVAGFLCEKETQSAYDKLVDRLMRARRPLVLGPGTGASDSNGLLTHVAVNLLNLLLAYGRAF